MAIDKPIKGRVLFDVTMVCLVLEKFDAGEPVCTIVLINGYHIDLRENYDEFCIRMFGAKPPPFKKDK